MLDVQLAQSAAIPIWITSCRGVSTVSEQSNRMVSAPQRRSASGFEDHDCTVLPHCQTFSALAAVSFTDSQHYFFCQAAHTGQMSTEAKADWGKDIKEMQKNKSCELFYEHI